MKRCLAAVLAFLSLMSADLAWAQDGSTGRLVRGDVTGAVGWLHVRKDSLHDYDDWNQTLFGSASVGFYWTDHLKLEAQAGASHEFSVYSSDTIEVDGRPFYGVSEYRFSARRLSLAGQYQFGRNQWFHPFLGAGIEVVAERVSEREQAVYSYDPVTRQSRLARPETDHPDHTDVKPMGLVQSGFKVYFHPRVFLLTDLRVGFGSDAKDVLMRFGLGVDF
jgi:opacity protein-like surface antigen